MKSFRSIKVSLLLVALSSCTFFSKDTKQLSAKSNIRFVDVTAPTLQTLSNRVSFIGFVEPQRFVTLHFVVPGRVETCIAKEGDVIKKDGEICQLDRSAVNLEVARARNAMNAAKKVMETNLAEKQKALFEAGVIGQAEFEQVRIQAETARASFQDSQSLHDMALKKLSEHTLRAPWEGTITKLLVKPGQPIAPEVPIAFLSNEEGLQIRTDLNAAHFHSLHIGNAGRINSISSKKLSHPIELQVIEKAPAVTPSTQSFQTSLALKNKSEAKLLTMGIIVSGEIDLERLDQVRVLPQTALSSWSQDGKASVFVVDRSGHLKNQDIEVGALTQGIVEVTSGLDDSAQVVTEIAPDFVEGLPVQIHSAEKTK